MSSRTHVLAHTLLNWIFLYFKHNDEQLVNCKFCPLIWEQKVIKNSWTSSWNSCSVQSIPLYSGWPRSHSYCNKNDWFGNSVCLRVGFSAMCSVLSTLHLQTCSHIKCCLSFLEKRNRGWGVKWPTQRKEISWSRDWTRGSNSLVLSSHH